MKWPVIPCGTFACIKIEFRLFRRDTIFFFAIMLFWSCNSVSSLLSSATQIIVLLSFPLLSPLIQFQFFAHSFFISLTLLVFFSFSLFVIQFARVIICFAHNFSTFRRNDVKLMEFYAEKRLFISLFIKYNDINGCYVSIFILMLRVKWHLR